MQTASQEVEPSRSLIARIQTNSRRLPWKFWLGALIWESTVGAFLWSDTTVAVPLSSDAYVGYLVAFLIPAVPVLFSTAEIRRGVSLCAILGGGWLALYGIIVGGSHAAVYLFPQSAWAYHWRYTLIESDLEGAEVTIDALPHDCEFWTAPVGSKHCHYDAEVVTVRMHRRSGTTLASFDDGRTWAPAEPSAKRWVYVSWTRVKD